LAVWWPRLLPARGTVTVPAGILELRSDAALDAHVAQIIEDAAHRLQGAGLDFRERQLILVCQSRACWRANVPPKWARATTLLLDDLIVLSPYVPLSPVPASTEQVSRWRPSYWELPASRHECAVRVVTHELAHVAHILQRGRLRAWRAGASEAEGFASRVARATAVPDSALTPTECAGAEA
jgi:hypothetical protein